MAEGEAIKLAQVQPFWLGEILVDPPTRRIVHRERSETLEPRVMQVLVVLAEARGSVISRDELIKRCWDGRIVGENAINRVISRIRLAANELGVASFHLETITKVGYRVVVPDDAASAPTDRKIDTPLHPQQAPRDTDRETVILNADVEPFVPLWRRRRFIAGSVAGLGAGAAALWFWERRTYHRPHPQAQELHRLAQIAQRQGVPEQVRQAVSFFKQATEIDPLYADAWGGLALSYRHILEGFAEGEKDSLPGLIESAARRALTLDPDNADAQVALVIIKPYYQNWGQMEKSLSRLAERYPDHWFILAQLGIIRYEVGRWGDGLHHTERQMEVEPYIPIPYYNRARALWSLGRLQEAEALLNAALDRWPAHPAFWNLKFDFLLANDRPESAAAFVMDPQTQPDYLQPAEIEDYMALIRAVERRDPDDVATVLAGLRDYEQSSVQSVQSTAALFVLLQRPDLAMDSIERYFFGSRRPDLSVKPPNKYDRRYSSFLFMPMMEPLWSAPRFTALLKRTRHEDYWRESGTLPDYRRRA